MLQQTRVETVTPYFARFMERFPTALALADASMDEVLSAWSGLGYYRRARLLHAGATEVANARQGEMPSTRAKLLELPGIGRYTAGAIASIAFGEAVGLVDGNVARVLARLFAIEEDMKKKGMKTAEVLADALVAKMPKKEGQAAGEFNQALMELGATICTPKKPLCGQCPVAKSCAALHARRVHELPVLSKPTKPKPVNMQALVLLDDEQKEVLLARRQANGLFGGLWEPPLIEGDDVEVAAEELLRRFPIMKSPLELRDETVTHVLSHRRLSIRVHAGMLLRKKKQKKKKPPPELELVMKLPDTYEAAALFRLDEIGTEKLGGVRSVVGLSTLARKILGVAIRDTNESERRGESRSRRRQRSS